MHFLLEGDMAEAGRDLAPGAFLTHAAGVVHGPHDSRGGARVLTVQSWQSHDGDFDFEPAEEGAPPQGAPRAGGPAQDRAAPQGAAQPVDQQAQQEARQEAAQPERRGYS
jgi:hypothetical protein